MSAMYEYYFLRILINPITQGISVFKFVIWGGISSDIPSEILFYGDALAEPLNIISERISDDIPPQMINLNMAIPILMYFLSFTHQNQIFPAKILVA